MMKRPEGMYDRVYGQDIDVKAVPHGWIQWKGTDVCVDLHCECGHHGHVDGDFFYYYECPECKRVYAVGQNIKLIELEGADREYVLSDRLSLHTDVEEDGV